MNEEREGVNLKSLEVPEVQRRTRELLPLVEQLAGLPEIIRSINTGSDLRQVLQRIASNTVRIVHRGASATINLWREHEGKLLPLAAAGPERRFLLDYPPRPDGIGMRVFRSGRPVVARQPDEVETIVSQAAREAGVRALACLPVKVEDRVLGTLYVDYRRDLPEYFTDNELAMLAIFADQAAVAIEKARLLEEAHQKARQLESLTEVVRTINAAGELSEVLQRIADSTVQIIRPRGSATINLWQESEGKLLPLAAAGPQRRFLITHPPRPDGIGMWVFHSGQTRVMRGEEVSDHVSQAAIEAGVRAFACLPVKFGHEMLGTLYVDYRHDLPSYFSADEVEMLSRLADHAAVAIRNTQLYEARQQSLTRLELIQQCKATVEEATSLPEVLRLILQVGLDLVHAQSGSLMLVDSTGQWLEIKARYGPPHRRPRDPRYRVGDETLPGWDPADSSIAGWVAHHNQPYLCPDVRDDSHFAPPASGKWHFRSLLSVPITSQGRVIGVINADAHKPNAFSERDRQLLLDLGGQVALAIERARLTQILDSLHQVGQSLIRLSPHAGLEKALQTIADRAREVLKIDLVTLYQFDQNRQEFLVEDTGPTISGPLLWADEKVMKRRVHRDDIPWKVVDRGKSLYFPDAERDPFLVGVAPARGDLPERPRFAEREKLRSSAALLLRVGEEIVGVMFTNYRTPHDFHEEERKVLETFANYAAIAIQNARLFERGERRRMQGWLDLREIDTAISTGQELREILHLILEKALELTRAQAGCVLRLDEDSGCFELRASHGLPDRETAEFGSRNGCWVARQVAETRKPLLVAVRDLPAELRQVIGKAGTELAVPMLRDGQVVGVISVRSEEEAAFSEEEQRFLETFAGQAVIAIQAAERYEALERLNQDLATATAIAWQGLSGSTWRHDVYGRILALRADVSTMHSRVKDQKSIEILNRIEQQASLITETAPTLPTKFTREPVNVNTALHAAFEKYRKLHPEVEFRRHLAREMPVVEANNAHLTAAFEILLDNAVQAVAKRAQKRISVTSQVTDNAIRIRISDSGPGIPEKARPYLFRQLVPDAQRTGMGALLARVAFQMYGGEIGVESTGPEGTRILVTLPVPVGQVKAESGEEEDAS
ncbi:MAG: GAF domain-containing protein [Anaerolineae bacterium]